MAVPLPHGLYTACRTCAQLQTRTASVTCSAHDHYKHAVRLGDTRLLNWIRPVQLGNCSQEGNTVAWLVPGYGLQTGPFKYMASPSVAQHLQWRSRLDQDYHRRQ